MKLKIPAARLLPQSLRLKWNVHEALRRGEAELHLLPALCIADQTSLDVGACRGVYSSLMMFYSAQVLAFEPQPYYATFIRKALRDVEVWECAASDVDANALLHVPVDTDNAGMAYLENLSGNCTTTATRQIEVRSLTLDSLELPRVGFMKIDVEGHELAVLRGAEKTIARCRPNLLIEAEERHRTNAVASVRDYLEAYGYAGWFLTATGLRPIIDFDPAIHQNLQSVFSNTCSPSSITRDYINNFIFVQPERAAAVIERSRYLRDPR